MKVKHKYTMLDSFPNPWIGGESLNATGPLAQRETGKGAGR
jgi:hypothetical protein